MKRAHALDGQKVLRLSTGAEIRLGNLTAGLLLTAGAVALALWSMSLGTTPVPLVDILAALTGTALSEDSAFAILDVRLPRILIGFMAGWSVAMTGAMLQSLAQHPLADPGLLGLSQGSMVAIMLVLVFAPDLPGTAVPLAALAGGIAVALVLSLLIGRATGGLAILLMGIAVETVLSSLTSILILYTPNETSYALSSWLAGSLFHSSWPSFADFAPWFALSLPGLILAGPALRIFDLGQESAMALGLNARLARPALLVLAVLLTATAVTAVGPLIFLGVMAPHLAQFLSPASGRARLVLAGLMGGVLVIGADCLTRGIDTGFALPIGLSLTILGVPLFILTLRLRALRTRFAH